MTRPTSASLSSRNMIIMLLVMIAVMLSVFVTHQLTELRIARNERAWLQAQLDAIVPPALHDNDILTDTTQVHAPDALGSDDAMTVYRARMHGASRAVIITSIAPDGYGGPITLLVGIDFQGKVLGVRILSHHETPGMGNDFELPGMHWLDSFIGRSLANPDSRGWNVRKDGGEFAQFTSATITPRAIVHAVARTLDYYQKHHDELYRQSMDKP
jgi:Na+-translocating ferredoxin:NAD+ oxidoreductase subunit G